MKFKIENCRKGFTLIELLVVIAIVAILAATAVVNFGKNADRDVRLEADRFIAFLRDVQNKALSSGKVSGVTVTGKLCGFGIHKSSDSEVWVYFVETMGSNKLNDDCSNSSISKTYPGGSYKIVSDTFYLRSNVKISNFSDTFFLIPGGEVYYGGSRTLSPDPQPLALTKTDGSVTATVNINLYSSGRIE